MHRDKIEKDHPLESRVREERLEELKKQLTTQQSLLIIVKGSSSTTDASFAVAKIIGKHKTPLVMRMHQGSNYGHLIPFVPIYHAKERSSINQVPLSRCTVARRIGHIYEDLFQQPVMKIKGGDFYSGVR